MKEAKETPMKTIDKWGLVHYGRRNPYVGKEDKFQKGIASTLCNIKLFSSFNWFHVPNGGLRPSKVNKKGKRYSPEAQKLKAGGAKKGVSDLILNISIGDFNGLNIEVKTKGGSLESEQVEYLLRDRANGYEGVVVWSYEGLALALFDYFGFEIISKRGTRVVYTKKHIPF